MAGGDAEPGGAGGPEANGEPGADGAAAAPAPAPSPSPLPSPPTSLATKLKNILGGLLATVGPLLVYYAFDWTLGLKPAIVACAVFSIGEVAWRLWHKEPITLLFKVTATTTVGFGVLDILLASPRFFSYEASITNAMFGLWFAWLMVKSPGPFVDEVVRQRPEVLERMGPAGRIRLEGLMRVLLAMVVAYHAVTAAAYLWIAAHYSVERAMDIRVIFGNASLVPFMALVYFGLQPAYRWALRFGWVAAPPR